jgi:RimJ/RimL family protein N-acetyltransferase
MIIVCDEANTRSAAIPQRIGYTLQRVESRTPEAPGETGRMQIWVFEGSAPTATR